MAVGVYWTTGNTMNEARRGSLRSSQEPPDAEPHVRWCEATEGVTLPPTRSQYAAIWRNRQGGTSVLLANGVLPIGLYSRTCSDMDPDVLVHYVRLSISVVFEKPSATSGILAADIDS